MGAGRGGGGSKEWGEEGKEKAIPVCAALEDGDRLVGQVVKASA